MNTGWILDKYLDLDEYSIRVVVVKIKVEMSARGICFKALWTFALKNYQLVRLMYGLFGKKCKQ